MLHAWKEGLDTGMHSSGNFIACEGIKSAAGFPLTGNCPAGRARGGSTKPAHLHLRLVLHLHLIHSLLEALCTGGVTHLAESRRALQRMEASRAEADSTAARHRQLLLRAGLLVHAARARSLEACITWPTPFVAYVVLVEGKRELAGGAFLSFKARSDLV